MATIKTYWIDQSCHQRGVDFDVYIREAMDLAGRAAARLQRVSDTDFARVYNIIFKTPKSDGTRFPTPYLHQLMNGFQDETRWKTAAQYARRHLIDFSTNWRRTDSRREANVRIYGDGGRRWIRSPHLEDQGRHYDPINNMYLTGNLRELRRGQAFTSYQQRHGIRGENPERVTIDLCQMAWEGPLHSFRDVCDMIRSQNATRVNIGDIGESLITRIIFHEFMHCRVYGRDDAPDDHDGLTSGWEYCMQLKKRQACAGAESIAYLALAAGLADVRPRNRTSGGFTFDRRWDAIPGSHDFPDPPDFDLDDLDTDEEVDEQFAWELAEIHEKRQGNRKWENFPGNSAVRGTLIFYDSITH
ncbi:hypothetical protein V8F20_011250 [Naviculisporaceae sp. PSN 640]